MQPMWLCVFLHKRFDNSQQWEGWRIGVEQHDSFEMQPMWLCVFLHKRFDDSQQGEGWRIGGEQHRPALMIHLPPLKTHIRKK